MIHLTRLNHRPLVLNADLIESIDVTPDTVISLTTGQKLVVLEPAEEVVRRVVEFRRAIYSGVLLSPSILAGQSEPGGDPVDRGGNRIGNG
ncbi:MAG: flagellar FlbD family protein [Bryobacteraceae bacterium]|jgi:flagellar protein FlbD